MRQLQHLMVVKWLVGRSERAASVVEYSLLVALIAVACMGALSFFGSSEGGNLTDSADSIVVGN